MSCYRIGSSGRRFNLNKLERAIKEIDALLGDTLDTKFICIISNEIGDIVRLTSYRSPHGRERLLCRVTLAALSFFNPIIIGDFEESFVNRAIGANNLVYKLSSSLKDKIKCLALIGTSVLSLTPFKDNVITIAIETEKIVERFSRNKLRLDNTGRYFRFNILRGLENIRLEDLKWKNAIITAIDRYIKLSGIEFARRHHRKFSLVLNRVYSAISASDINAVIKDIIKRGGGNADPNVYNITRYLLGVDYGSVLIITRLANLEQLTLFLNRYRGRYSKNTSANYFRVDLIESEELFRLLNSLPLSGISIARYIRLYKHIVIANLLLLWYGLFIEVSMQSRAMAGYLLEWLPNVINDEVDFIIDIASYTTYPVVYKWAFYI
ncbi:FabD/lysophospholipase-like protein [Cenococcum geophilum]